MGAEQAGFFSEPGTCCCWGGDAAEKTSELSWGFDRWITLGHKFLYSRPIAYSNWPWDGISQWSGAGSFAAIAVTAVVSFFAEVFQ